MKRKMNKIKQNNYKNREPQPVLERKTQPDQVVKERTYSQVVLQENNKRAQKEENNTNAMLLILVDKLQKQEQKLEEQEKMLKNVLQRLTNWKAKAKK